MYKLSTLVCNSRSTTLLAWCVAGSVAAHLLLLTLLPGGRAAQETPAAPLIVSLLTPPPEMEPPQPLPMAERPVEKERAKPALPKPAPREEPPLEQPRIAPILSTPLAAPAAPVLSIAPEQKPAPPLEPPRTPLAALAPVTAPRSDAAYLNNPRPAYPLAARRRGDQGTVLVRVLVSAEGLAASVTLEKTSNHPALDEAALTAVKSWRFIPARQGGQAVEAPYVVPIVFKVE